MYEHFARRRGLPRETLRFLLDGERTDSDHTPAILSIDDNDQIDCVKEQCGC